MPKAKAAMTETMVLASQNGQRLRARDGRPGRHVAQEISRHLHAGASLPDAMARAIATSMGRRIVRRIRRGTRMPAVLPRLTGFVLDEGIAIEAARAGWRAPLAPPPSGGRACAADRQGAEEREGCGRGAWRP